jgi:hypothetical protein
MSNENTVDLSSFDPETFLQNEFEGASPTSFIPIPEGEYTATITKVEFRTVETQGGPKVILEVTWKLLDQEELAAQLEMETLTARQSIWLDLAGPGRLAFGTNLNVGLGRLREALNMNATGGSFADFVDSVATVVVKHRPGKDDAVFAEVKEVRKAD